MTVVVFVLHLPSSHVVSCHLSERGAKQALCKTGAEVVDCPDQATCGRGSILACVFPLEKKMDGSACVLIAAAEEEVKAVVEALR